MRMGPGAGGGARALLWPPVGGPHPSPRRPVETLAGRDRTGRGGGGARYRVGNRAGEQDRVRGGTGGRGGSGAKGVAGVGDGPRGRSWGKVRDGDRTGGRAGAGSKVGDSV